MLKIATGFVVAASALASFAATASADWRGGSGWRDHRPHHGLRCVAEARRGGGSGPELRGVRGVGFGRDACREALSECHRELRFVKSTGRAPFASCVITRRG